MLVGFVTLLIIESVQSVKDACAADRKQPQTEVCLRPFPAEENGPHAYIEFHHADTVSARDGEMTEFMRDDDHAEYDQKNENTDNHISTSRGQNLPIIRKERK